MHPNIVYKTRPIKNIDTYGDYPGSQFCARFSLYIKI